jgi:hypothetical protein
VTPLLQPHPESVGPPIGGVRHYPPRGHGGREGPLQHLLGQFYPIAEDDLLGNAGLRSPEGAVRPSLRQIESTLEEKAAPSFEA